MKKISGWARSRSRRRDSQGKDIEKRASTENLAPPNGQAIPAKTVPPVPQIPQQFRAGRSIDNNNTRPGSSSRIKPMLVGVSRPSGSHSRPGTGGSLQNAVTSAADKVAQSPSSELRPGNTRSHSSRYIDIFSISNPKTTRKTYNEEIAERNLDTNILAKEVMKDEYVPSSRYQEEVAARNAAPPLRSSMDQVDLSSPNGYRPNYAELRSYSKPKENRVPRLLLDDDDRRKFQEIESSPHHEHRRRRGPSGEHLPSTSVSTKAQHGMRSESGSANHNRIGSRDGVARQVQPASPEKNAAVALSRSPTDSQGSQARENRPRSTSQPVPNGTISAGTLPGYQVSRSELSQPREAGTQPMFQQFTRDRPRISERGQSSMSTASSVKRTIALPHRTIMDLTGEDFDVFSDGYHRSDMSRSPAIDQARQGVYSKIHPPDLNLSTGPEAFSDSMYPPDDSNFAPRSSIANEQHNRSPEAAMQYPPSSTFSAINTVASMSPKVKENARRKPVPEMAPVPVTTETRQQASSKLYTVAETEPEPGKHHQQYSNGDKGTSLSSHSVNNSEMSHFEALSAPIVKRHDFATGQKGLEQKPVIPPSPSTSLRTPRQSQSAQSTPNHIQLSPESLHSADFINPSNSFGVRTRDFAVTPSKSVVLQPVHRSRADSEPNTGAKITAPLYSKPVNFVLNGGPVNPSSPEDPATNKYSSGFDEEEFKRKQELARAALVKLQQSLNEELSTPPRETKKAQPRANSARRHANSNVSNDGRSYAPPSSSVFTQVRTIPRPATSQANGHAQSRSASQPHTAFSVHEQVTKPRSGSPALTATMKPVRQQVLPNRESMEGIRRSHKGKEKELSHGLTEMQRLAQDMKITNLAMPNPIPQRIYEDSISPSARSPGEISLSSFPVPTPAHSRQTSTVSNKAVRPSQQHRPSTSSFSAFSAFSQAGPAHSPGVGPPPGSPDLQNRHMLSRRGSTKSQTSVMTGTSQHSIPYHLIPDRGSSMRDSLVREEDELEA